MASPPTGLVLRYAAIVPEPTDREQGDRERREPADQQSEASRAPAAQKERRWQLIRDVLVFQVKMIVEGLRDVLLVPATLLAAAFGVFLGGERPERMFHDVLRAGHRFDTWLNLFGPTGQRPPPQELASGEDPTIDQYFERIEEKLVEQHGRGGMTRSARQAVDSWLDTIQNATRKKQ